MVSGIPELFPARESLVSDIQAGDGKIANLFLQCSFYHPPDRPLDPGLTTNWQLQVPEVRCLFCQEASQETSVCLKSPPSWADRNPSGRARGFALRHCTALEISNKMDFHLLLKIIVRVTAMDYLIIDTPKQNVVI